MEPGKPTTPKSPLEEPQTKQETATPEDKAQNLVKVTVLDSHELATVISDIISQGEVKKIRVLIPPKENYLNRTPSSDSPAAEKTEDSKKNIEPPQ